MLGKISLPEVDQLSVATAATHEQLLRERKKLDTQIAKLNEKASKLKKDISSVEVTKTALQELRVLLGGVPERVARLRAQVIALHEKSKRDDLTVKEVRMAKAEAEALARDLVSYCPHTLVMYTPHQPPAVAGKDPTYEQRYCCLCGLHESEGSFKNLVDKQGRLFKQASWRDLVTQAQLMPLEQLLESFVTAEQRATISTLLEVK